MEHQGHPSTLPSEWLEHIDIPAVLYRLDGTFELINPAAELLLSRRASDLVGKTYRDAYPCMAGAWEECFLRVAGGQAASARTELHDHARDTYHENCFFRVGERVLVLLRDTTAEYRARDTSDHLMALVDSLSGSMSTDQMVRAVLTTGTALFHADAALVGLVARDGTSLRIIDAVGMPPEHVDPHRRMPLSLPIPDSDVVKGGQPLFLSDLDELARLYPHLAEETRRHGRHAFAILPLRVQDTVYGIIAFGFENPRGFTDEDRVMLTTVARHCALVVERARLRERETEALTEQRAQTRRTRALAKASRVFAEAAAERQPARRICELLVERALLLLSSSCLVQLVRPDGLLDAVAWADPDPSHRQIIGAVLDKPMRPNGPIEQALRQDRIVFLPDPDALAHSIEPEYQHVVAGSGLYSLIVAPIRVEGRPIGTLCVGRNRSQPGAPFRAEDAELVQELGDRAGLAIAAVRAREAAEAGTARMRLLYNLTTRLSQAFHVEDVATVTIEETRGALQARAALVMMLDEDQSSVRIVSSSGYPPELAGTFQGMPLDAPTPMAQALRTRAPVFIESLDDLSARFPDIVPASRAAGIQGGAAFPLMGNSGLIGGLGVQYTEPHVFTQGERELLLAFSAATGQALERASLYEREHRAREALERASARLSRMHAISAALVGAVTEADVGQIVANEGCAAFAARCAVVRVPRAEGDLELIGMCGLAPELVERVRRVPVTADYPVCVAYRSGAPVWIESRAQRPRDLAIDEATRDKGTGAAAAAAMPLAVEGRIVGALGFGFVEERTFSTEDRELALTLASLAAAALERVRLYHEAEAARRAAEAASQTKDEFLAMLGHELRNPLAPIATALQLMDMKLGDTAVRERGVIDRQVSHLTRLVDDLLDVSRITRGKIDLHRAPIEIAHIVETAVERVGPLIEERQHALVVRVPHQGLVVSGDEDRLCQVLTNLLTNAARYTERGGRIEVEARQVDGLAEIVVRDNGIGIEPQLLPRLFELFVQGARTIDRREGGLGLGLTVVKRLVELHGGTVEARSQGRGRGSELIVRLLLVAPDLASDVAITSPGHGEPAGVGPPEPRGVRVLVVDDNQDAALLTCQALEAHGYQTRVAFDGAAAVDEARDFQPRVVLLDIGLPIMDGYEASRHLRALPAGADFKLVALTGYGQESDRQRSMEAGFDEHLTKPVKLAHLLEAVARLSAA
jgi:GAF domain-containing protein/CheY-like chemotaxis protein/anti-sigma regulatory factor (Ser/Thr protein kinase)